MSEPEVVVVGAGVAGLAAAWALGRAGRSVLVLERSGRVGGLVETEITPDGLVFEHGADGVLSSKPGGMPVLQALDLAGSLAPKGRAPKRAFVWTEAGLLPMPGGLFSFERRALATMMSSPLLSARAKLRLALEPLVPRQALPDEPVASFFARRLGPEAEARLCAPMVRGIYGAESSEVGVRAVFPTLASYEDRFGSVGVALAIAPRSPRGAGLVSPSGGMKAIPERLAERCRARIVLGRGVASLERRPGRIAARLDDGSTLEAGALVVATDVGTAARLAAPLSAPLAELLGDVRATDVEVVTFAFPRAAVSHRLDGTGFVVARAGVETLATTFASEKWSGRAPDGVAIFRSVLRGARDATEAELARMALAELRSAVGVEGAPIVTRVRRRPRALPVHGVGHGARTARALALAGEVGRFAIAGNYLSGVGVPDAIQSGIEAAAAVGRDLGEVTATARP